MRIRWIILLLILIQTPCSADEQTPITWKRLADKIQLGIAKLSGPLFPGEVILLKTKPEHYEPYVVRAAAYGKRRASVTSLAKSSKSPICINASFFDPEGKPLGLVVSRGVLHSKIHKGGSILTGVFQRFRNRIAIEHRSKLGETYGLEAFQAGPRLIVDGSPAKGLNPNGTSSRRSGLCISKEGEILLFAITSALRGATLHELAELLLQPSTACHQALNLDGGGSSQLYVSSNLLGAAPGFSGIELSGRDDVPVALCLRPNI